ncbi:hypothetical protein BGX23_003136, partial [Mortierella sp. AD031]
MSRFCDAEGWTTFSTSRAMDFTLCFQNSVLTLIPSVALMIFLSPRLLTVVGKGHLEGVKATPVFVVKMVAVLASFAVQLGILIKVISDNDLYGSSSILSSGIYLAGLAGAALLHWFEHFNMPNPSSSLLLYWLFSTLISIFPTRSWIQVTPEGLSATLPILKLIFSILAAVVFILENIPKPSYKALRRPDIIPPVQINPSPEPYSNYFKRITFFWLLPLLRLGKSRSLRMDDLYNINPKLLSYPFYTESAKAKGEKPQTAWMGFGYVIAVITASILSSLFDGQFQYINYNAGLKARSVFVTLVYRKSLRLSTTNKQEGMGAIVNHMSTDVDKVVAFFDIIHLLWSAVVEVIVTIALLYKEVRYTIFASLGVVVVMIVIVGICSPFVGRNQKAAMKASDTRMKLITELVGAIKSIKL